MDQLKQAEFLARVDDILGKYGLQWDWEWIPQMSKENLRNVEQLFDSGCGMMNIQEPGKLLDRETMKVFSYFPKLIFQMAHIQFEKSAEVEIILYKSLIRMMGTKFAKEEIREFNEEIYERMSDELKIKCVFSPDKREEILKEELEKEITRLKKVLSEKRWYQKMIEEIQNEIENL